MEKIHVLVAERAKAFDAFAAHGAKKDFADADQPEYDRLKAEVEKLDKSIERAKAAQTLAAAGAQPAPGQDELVPAAVETDKYVKDKSLLLGAFAKTIGLAGGDIFNASARAKMIYGESHPVTKSFMAATSQKALVMASGASGGFIVPPDVMTEIIELLRAKAVVRGAGPRNIPMPRGTMTLPGQASAATATYGTETGSIGASQQTLRQIVATYKKLSALVPVSNDMMRYADPAVDAFVRDDIVKVMALREDLAFLIGDGTQSTPRGFLSFANTWVGFNGGTIGSWSTTANSVYAVNAADPANTTGGNFITSNATVSLVNTANELGGAVNRLDTANVPEDKRCWFFHPRIYNYLYNLINSLGLYVYRDELDEGKLLGYPFRKTTQIPTTYWDSAGSVKTQTFIFLAEMTEAMILDSMQLELAVSREGSYVDSTGATVSAFQSDQTIIRAIAEHDFQLRHDQSVAVIQGVAWAPAIS
jgi:HK97 family phage major capsid protein